MAQDRVATAGTFASDVTDVPAVVKRTTWGAIIAGVTIGLVM